MKIKHWWWESNVVITDRMRAAILDEFDRFATYLGTDFQKECVAVGLDF